MPLLYWSIHFFVILLLCGLALFCLKKTSRNKWIPLVFLLPLIFLQLLFFWIPEKIANWFEWPDLVFFSQYYFHLSILIGLFSLSFVQPKYQKIRVGVLCSLLIFLSGYASSWIVYSPGLKEGYLDHRSVWIQGTSSSCSAAAGATALSKLGIGTSEPEMARLCLTERRGTHTLGLYRGLALKAREKAYHVRFKRLTLADLRKTKLPVILSAGLREGIEPHLRRALEESWRWGERHAVVFLGFFHDGRVIIADPRVGEERWPLSSLLALWDGWAIVFEK